LSANTITAVAYLHTAEPETIAGSLTGLPWLELTVV
jgi:hypothetical protein